jgi:hypothetical protein
MTDDPLIPDGLLREGEPLLDAARRVAIDAIYHERDAGRTMEDAGKRAASHVLAVIIDALRAGPQPPDRWDDFTAAIRWLDEQRTPPIIRAMTAMAERHDQLVQEHGFTHTGTVPMREELGGADGISGEILEWGLRHPEPALYAAAPRRKPGEVGFFRVNRDLWDIMTRSSPPYPWKPDGEELDIPPAYPDDHELRRRQFEAEADPPGSFTNDDGTIDP